MKLFYICFLLCFVMAFAAHSLSEKQDKLPGVQHVTIYTYDSLPPFAYRDAKGELTGLYIDLVRTAVSRMQGYQLSFKVVPWQRAKLLAENGSAFAILPPYFHAHDWLLKEEKRPFVWPYSLPLYTQQDLLVCNETVATTGRIDFPEDYKSLSFVMWRGDGRAGEKFAKMEHEGEIAVMRVNDVKTTLELLRLGRADCTVTSRIPYMWLTKQLRSEDRRTGEQPPVSLREVAIISSNYGFLGYTDVNDEQNFPFKDDFVLKFAIEIYHMKRTGEDRRIINRFTQQFVDSATDESVQEIWVRSLHP